MGLRKGVEEMNQVEEQLKAESRRPSAIGKTSICAWCFNSIPTGPGTAPKETDRAL